MLFTVIDHLFHMQASLFIHSGIQKDSISLCNVVSILLNSIDHDKCHLTVHHQHRSSSIPTQDKEHSIKMSETDAMQPSIQGPIEVPVHNLTGVFSLRHPMEDIVPARYLRKAEATGEIGLDAHFTSTLPK